MKKNKLKALKTTRTARTQHVSRLLETSLLLAKIQILLDAGFKNTGITMSSDITADGFTRLKFSTILHAEVTPEAEVPAIEEPQSDVPAVEEPQPEQEELPLETPAEDSSETVETSEEEV